VRSHQEPKSRVATEAATLLYCGAEKEYKQAKLKAAEILGTPFLPSNRDVALELDRIIEEREGSTRRVQLIEMREEALRIMTVLVRFYPLLIGSVWRGTPKKGSDIDIAVYNDAPEEILSILEAHGFTISTTEWVSVTKLGKTTTTFHIKINHKHPLELVVRNLDEVSRKRVCEVFGDEIKGLNVQNLSEVLAKNPAQKFLPT
jgi:predicted nucleotidyltransferase